MRRRCFWRGFGSWRDDRLFYSNTELLFRRSTISLARTLTRPAREQNAVFCSLPLCVVNGLRSQFFLRGGGCRSCGVHYSTETAFGSISRHASVWHSLVLLAEKVGRSQRSV